MTGKTIQSKTGVRKLHKESQSKHENRPKLAFLLQDWGDAYNVGGMFRVADACGAHELVMCGKTPVPPNPMIGVTSLGHHRRVAWRQIERYDDAARQLVEEGWHLVAVEIAEVVRAICEACASLPRSSCSVVSLIALAEAET